VLATAGGHDAVTRLACSFGNIPILVLLFWTGCGGVHGSPEDLGDLIFGVSGSIPREKLGVQNEFVVNPIESDLYQFLRDNQ